MKKRILVDGDTSTANSGFAIYKKKLMTALADCPHFEVAEIGSGGFMHDKEKVPWKYYPTSVLPSDERYREYSSDPRNEYGAWRFDKIMLHFRSDVYLGFSDPWQLAHAVSSVLRPYYHVMISPTVDSIPQRQDFLQIYAQADSIYTYTDWAADYLREKGLPCIGSIPMGIDPNVFKPIDDKGNHKQKYGIPADSIVFGFVARNQLRKRFPDIIESFALYLKMVPKEVADKSYLYFHTSHMDVGWDLVTHLLEQKVINKVLFTYFCRKTGEIFVSTFKGERLYSPYSNELSAFSPNVVQSPTEDQLNDVYNLFDYYLQPATCFDKDTNVFTSQGWKKIKDVSIGDEVYTHNKQYRKVTQTFKNVAPKQLLNIYVHGKLEPLKVTEDHPMMAYTKDVLGTTSVLSLRETIGAKLRSNTPIKDSEFIEAGRLQVGDFLVLPTNMAYELDVTNELDCAKFACPHDVVTTNKIEVCHRGHLYDRYLKPNDTFFKFIGLCIADGYIYKNLGGVISISCHQDENIPINLSIEFFNSLSNKTCSIIDDKRAKALNVMFSSVRHAKLFRSMLYNENNDKVYPNWIFNSSPYQQKLALHGLFIGDGSSCRNGSILATTSKPLAYQVEKLLLNNGYMFNSHKVIKSGNRKLQYRFELTSDLKSGIVEPSPRSNTRNVFLEEKNEVLLQIRKIEKVNYEEKHVYTLEVDEDHSYTTEYGIAKNCEGWGCPQLEAAACNIPIMVTGYSAMQELGTIFGGKCIEPGTLNYEHGVMARRASLDIQRWADGMVEFALNRPRINSREIVLQKYTWRHNFDKWINAIDRAGRKESWNSPIKQYGLPPLQGQMTATQFLYLLSNNVPQLRWSTMNLANIQSLNRMCELRGKQVMAINPQHIAQKYQNIISDINKYERIRVGLDKLELEDFLE